MKQEQLIMLREIVQQNIEILAKRMNWKQNKLAEVTGVSEPSVSKYIRGKQLPPLEFLVSLCTSEEVKLAGIDINLDKFISEVISDKKPLEKKTTAQNETALKHLGFLGVYLCYSFDHGNAEDAADAGASRDVRCGVVAVLEDYNHVLNNRFQSVIAVFPDEDDERQSRELKAHIEKMMSGRADLKTRNDEIYEYCKRFRLCYTGQVTFNRDEAYISLSGTHYKDHAMVIMYAPAYRTETSYIGGIGTLAMVAHGATHAPTAQKIVLSTCALNCTEEMLADYLNLTTAFISQESEAQRLCDLCCKLYSGEGGAELFDESDKRAMIAHRLNQLVKNYIDKNICCVGMVSAEDDRAIVRLIEQQSD